MRRKKEKLRKILANDLYFKKKWSKEFNRAGKKSPPKGEQKRLSGDKEKGPQELETLFCPRAVALGTRRRGKE